MGSVIILFMMLVIISLSVVLLILRIVTGKSFFTDFLAIIWGCIILLLFLGSLFNNIVNVKILTRDNYYGTYVVDEKNYPGEQANWQYDHYRFEINRADELILFVIDGNGHENIYKTKINTVKPHSSERLVIDTSVNNHHILRYNPTIYRECFGFYMVFNTNYGNMFFRKESMFF